MWSAKDLALARFRGTGANEAGSGKVDLLPACAGWLGDQHLAAVPWVAGVESMSVGWPVRCLRATYVWGSLSEQDRVDRARAIEGCDLPTEWAARFFGVASPQPPRDIVPTHVLWRGMAINVCAWAVAFLGVISLPHTVRVVRGVWWRRRGRCERCGYDMAALSRGTACPECGAIPF
jgi:hypothetical protein